MDKRVAERIEIPGEMYSSLKRIAWKSSFAERRIRYVSLDEIILSAYISGLQHGMAATEELIEEEAKDELGMNFQSLVGVDG